MEPNRATTLADVLTMTSGFVDPTGIAALSRRTHCQRAQPRHVFIHAGRQLQLPVLHPPAPRTCHPLVRPDNPDAYAQMAVFPALGIDAGSYSWPTVAGSLQGSAYSLEMTVEQMAKLGQLYLQGGRSSAAQQLVSSSYVTSSTTYHEYWGEWPTSCGAASSEKFIGYGFQWWMQRSKAAAADGTDIDYYCAIGHLGQFVCVYPSLDAVFATASDQYAGACALLGLVPSLLSAGADAESEACTIPSVDSPTSGGTGGSAAIIAVAVGAAGSVLSLVLVKAAAFVYHTRRSRAGTSGRHRRPFMAPHR